MTVTDPNYFCVTSSSIWQFAGFLLFALKIIIPLIIIILGVIDFVNATISSKDDAIAAATKSLLFRLIIGVVVFFVPMIVSLIFNLIENASDAVASADACQKCLLRPFIEDCASYVAQAKSIRENQKNQLDDATHSMSDYITSSARCFYCPDEQQYVWTTNPKCRASQYIKRYTTKEACENPDNLTLMPNIVGTQEEPEENTGGSLGGTGGWSTNGNYLKFYGALSVLHSGQPPYKDNTLELYNAAGESNFYGAECDLRMSGNTLYCSHDVGPSVATKFEDYLAVCKKYKMTAILDIKYASSNWNYSYSEMLNVLGDYINDNNLQNSLIVQTSYLDTINQINGRASGVRYWFLITNSSGYTSLTNKMSDFKNGGVIAANVSANVMSQSVVNNLHDNGVKVCTYSIDGDSLRSKYAGYGVDYIMTNLTS